ncbi:MAG: hypothetical protein ABFD81_04795 [Syntrophaceae bacterium]
MQDRTLDSIGSIVDELFLAPGRLIASLQARRAVNWRMYAREAAYYHEMGYVDQPMNFFSRPAEKPAYRIESQTPYQGGACQVISFPSGFVPHNPFIRRRYMAYPENRTGYLVRWVHGDKPRKTVLCVHGFMMGEPREAERMFKIRKLYGLGLDVALCVLPFHWRRIKGGRSARRIYLTLGDAAFTNECIAQSVFDLDNAFLILAEMGITDIGMVGASLGGYVTGVYACLRDHMRFAALMVPALSFLRPLGPDRFLKSAPYDDAWRAQVLRAADFYSPLNLTPRIPSENILVVASRGDRVCPFDLVEDLERRWRLTRCHFRTGGHWLVFDSLRGRAWYGFLKALGFMDGPQ